MFFFFKAAAFQPLRIKQQQHRWPPKQKGEFQQGLGAEYEYGRSLVQMCLTSGTWSSGRDPISFAVAGIEGLSDGISRSKILGGHSDQMWMRHCGGDIIMRIRSSCSCFLKPLMEFFLKLHFKQDRLAKKQLPQREKNEGTLQVDKSFWCFSKFAMIYSTSFRTRVGGRSKKTSCAFRCGSPKVWLFTEEEFSTQWGVFFLGILDTCSILDIAYSQIAKVVCFRWNIVIHRIL